MESLPFLSRLSGTPVSLQSPISPISPLSPFGTRDDVEEYLLPSQKRRWIRLPERGFSPGLEGLRGFAICLTAISHVATRPYAATDPLGAVGVTLFYVLSGYNIMGSLLRLERSKKATNSPWRTVLVSAHIHRWKRLAPTLYATIFLTAGLYIYQADKAFSFLLRYALLALTFSTNLSTFWIDNNPGPFPNTWSLGVTEQYNLLSSLLGPMLLYLSARNRRNTLVVVILASYTLRFYTAAWPGTIFGIDSHFNVLCNVFRFAIGALLRVSEVPRVLVHSWTAYIGMALALLPIQLMVRPQPNYAAFAPGLQDIFAAMTLWSDVIVAFAACLIIIGSRTINKVDVGGAIDPRGRNRILESEPAQFMGKISYGFYCYQLPILIYSGWPRGWPGWCCEAMALILAIATRFWLDLPLQQYLKNRGKPALGTDSNVLPIKQG